MRLFSVAWVPTGIKAGVSILPCGVVITPLRPSAPGRRWVIVKRSADCIATIVARGIMACMKAPQVPSIAILLMLAKGGLCDTI